MQSNTKLDNEIQQLINKINEIELTIESQNQEESQFFQDLDINLEKVTSFVEKEENFNSENWQELQRQQSVLTEKLSLQLSSIKDPRKTKKDYSSLQGIRRHWLYVR